MSRNDRRSALKTMAGMAVVLAIPIAAVLATAEPIPNPPSRRALNFISVEETATAAPTDRTGKPERQGRQRAASGEDQGTQGDRERRRATPRADR